MIEMIEIYIYVFLAISLIFSALSLRKGMIDSYKISYYETKLKNRGVDISHIENIGLIEIIKS